MSPTQSGIALRALTSTVCSCSVTPSYTEVQSWSIEPLRDAACRWSSTADHWEDAYSVVSRQIAEPGSTPWLGDAAEAARGRATRDATTVQDLTSVLRTCAVAAASAAVDIDEARSATLWSIGEAQAEGFLVSEDLSLTDRLPVGSYEELLTRGALAEQLEGRIRTRADALYERDCSARDLLMAAATGLTADVFRKPTTQDNDNRAHLVDYRHAPVPEKPSWTSPEPPPGGWSDDPITRAAQKIAFGHASSKHLVNEWPPGTTREQLASEVERIMRAGTSPAGGMIAGRTVDGAPAIYDPTTNTLVIRDPGAADAGTVFRPTRGESYVSDKMTTKLPSLSATELADAPPKTSPETPRLPRVGLPPVVGVPPLVGESGGGAGNIPVLDSGGTPDVGLPGTGR